MTTTDFTTFNNFIMEDNITEENFMMYINMHRFMKDNFSPDFYDGDFFDIEADNKDTYEYYCEFYEPYTYNYDLYKPENIIKKYSINYLKKYKKDKYEKLFDIPALNKYLPNSDAQNALENEYELTEFYLEKLDQINHEQNKSADLQVTYDLIVLSSKFFGKLNSNYKCDTIIILKKILSTYKHNPDKWHMTINEIFKEIDDKDDPPYNLLYYLIKNCRRKEIIDKIDIEFIELLHKHSILFPKYIAKVEYGLNENLFMCVLDYCKTCEDATNSGYTFIDSEVILHLMSYLDLEDLNHSDSYGSQCMDRAVILIDQRIALRMLELGCEFNNIHIPYSCVDYTTHLIRALEVHNYDIALKMVELCEPEYITKQEKHYRYANEFKEPQSTIDTLIKLRGNNEKLENIIKIVEDKCNINLNNNKL